MTTADTFQALVVDAEGSPAELRSLRLDDLPEGDTLVKVKYSSVNYKDALAVHSVAPVLRSFPMVPGIDLAGVVVSSTGSLVPGTPVLCTGWGIGESQSGGFAEYARVSSEWLLPLPEGLSLEGVMQVGTAGLTAMLCVISLERHGLTPAAGPVVVSGASGGVGLFASLFLSRLGFQVWASTGSASAEPVLESFGVHRVVSREDVLSEKPLAKEFWAAGVDCVGGETLTGMLSRISYGGAVAACGLAGSLELHGTVYPFILRAVSILGVDSVRCPNRRRMVAWDRIAQLVTEAELKRVTEEISLADVPERSRALLEGRQFGRLVVRV